MGEPTPDDFPAVMLTPAALKLQVELTLCEVLRDAPLLEVLNIVWRIRVLHVLGPRKPRRFPWATLSR